VLVGTETVTELPEVVVTVVFAPPFILYVNVNGAVPAVPVKVICGWVAFRQLL